MATEHRTHFLSRTEGTTSIHPSSDGIERICLSTFESSLLEKYHGMVLIKILSLDLPGRMDTVSFINNAITRRTKHVPPIPPNTNARPTIHLSRHCQTDRCMALAACRREQRRMVCMRSNIRVDWNDYPQSKEQERDEEV